MEGEGLLCSIWGRWGDAGQIQNACSMAPRACAFAALQSSWPQVAPLYEQKWFRKAAQGRMQGGVEIGAITSCRLSLAVSSGCCGRSIMAYHHLKHCSLYSIAEPLLRTKPGFNWALAAFPVHISSVYHLPGWWALLRGQGHDIILSSALGRWLCPHSSHILQNNMVISHVKVVQVKNEVKAVFKLFQVEC